MSEQDILALLQKIQNQMTFLEKKLDTLLQQTQPRPFNREADGQRPYRPFKRPYQGGGYGGQNRGPGGPSGYGNGPADGRGNFYPKKKPFFQRDGDRPHEGPGKFFPKKKPFFNRDR